MELQAYAILAAIGVAIIEFPVSRDRLAAFATSHDLVLTAGNGNQVLTRLAVARRRQRYGLAAGVVLAIVAGEPYLVALGWFAGILAAEVRQARAQPDNELLIGWAAAVALSSVGLLMRGEVDWPRIGTLILVAAAVPLALATPHTDGEVARALGRRGARLLLIGGVVTAVCAAYVPPLPSAEPPPVYADVDPYPEDSVDLWQEAVTKVGRPSCYRSYGPECRVWELDRRPFPQAAGVVTDAHGVPRPGPLRVSADGHWIAYLDRASRRIVHRDLRTSDVRYLTGPLADADVPGVEISGQGRFVTMSTASTIVHDTSNGAEVTLPAIREILDVGGERFAGTSGSELIVFDKAAKPLFRTPIELDDPQARFYPDHKKILIVRPDRTRVDTYDVLTGKRLHSVAAELPDGKPIEAVTGWKEGRPVVTRQAGEDERTTFTLDPATGRTTHVRGSG